MLYVSSCRINKFLAGLTALVVIAVLLFTAALQVVNAAEPVALTVTGDGVDKTVQFTLNDLKKLPQKTYTYSGYNHWPSLQIFSDMSGPTLQSILDAACLKDSATLIRVKSTGGAYSDFTKDQILKEPRYYFPDGEKPGDVTDWPPQRSERGKKAVETIIALNQANGKLFYGQCAPNEPTCCQNQMLGAVCNGGTVEVLTMPLERWAMPHADPAPGKVDAGTKVTLQHEDGAPYHAIVYYTLDGSEPTYGSYVFNISYPHFQPEMNRPIPVNKDVTIKTRTIGMGKLDSEVATYKYYTGSPASVDEAPDQAPDQTEGKGTGAEKPDQARHFVDVEKHWAKDKINYLLEKGIIAGMTATEFKPQEKITRAQFAKLLVAALDLEVNQGVALSFEDVPTGAWYRDAVATAVNAGLTSGYSDRVFAPDENITREQMASIISRALQMKSSETVADGELEQIINKFKDKGDISPWARQGIALAVSRGIVGGVSADTFAPKLPATRAEAAVMIWGLYHQLDLS
jgi:hypothetical protein